MRICVLDLEMNQPSGNIIEVGYVIVDTDTDECLLKASHYIDLPEDEHVSQYITELTGITQADLNDWGMTLKESFELLTEHMKEYSCCRHLFVWGQGDVKCLKDQAQEGYLSHVYDRFFNVKTEFQSYCIANGISIRQGLAKALKTFGMPFEGKAHRALDDAYNTARIYLRLLKNHRS